MKWDDLQIIAAIRDCGTFAGAATRLRLDETTVARRLARLQGAIGVPLFQAVDGQRRPTRQCEAILVHVDEMARRAAAIGQVASGAADLSGRFRIASTSSIAEDRLAPGLGAFLTRNPGICVELMTSNSNANFARWEADFAIRLRRPDKGNFSISKLADIGLYLFEPATPTRSDGAPFVCIYPSELDHTPEFKYLTSRGLDAQGRCVTANVRVIKTLLRSHACIGILPDFICGDLFTDRSLTATELGLYREAWLLVQPHLKHDPAARITIDWINHCFAGDKIR